MDKDNTQEISIISIAGIKRGDLVYYLARMLASFGEPVLCVDNSTQNGVFRSVSRDNASRDAYVKNITFIRNAAFNAKVVRHFRYVIVYHEMSINQKWWEESSKHYVITNFDRFDIDNVRDLLNGVELSTTGLIITNRWLNQISDRYVYEKLGFSANIVDAIFEVPNEEAVEAARISFQYNRISSMKTLPSSLKKMLFSWLKNVTDIDAKTKMNTIFSQC